MKKAIVFLIELPYYIVALILLPVYFLYRWASK